jgi:hypothetical protein
MVPTVLLGYFVLLFAVLGVVTGTVAWYWGVAMVVGFIALERIFFSKSKSSEGDEALDKQHDAHLPPDQRPGHQVP